jgi:glutamate--cysteine ligase
LSDLAERRLARLLHARQEGWLRQGRIGLEKESLRAGPDGAISQRPHPRALGSALTHPWITTDYSEALLELITPPFEEQGETLDFLADAHAFVYEHLDDQILWATSMPCVLAGGGSIPIAQYGSSNLGRMKTVYRRGLGYRYGRTMQVISGVHFNYSFAEGLWPELKELDGAGGPLRNYIDGVYFAMLRNLQRVGWLIPYLFGASPAVCKSFLLGKRTTLPEFDANTFYEPYATSLRMGDIGYTNTKEGETGIKACYDSLERYVESLTCAIETPYPDYERIGLLVNGEWRQLNPNILQIENEYYSTVRPKQVLEGNEKPSLALKRRGVRYVELRSLDVNAYHPLGVEPGQLRFIEALLTYCMLSEGPPISALERTAIDQNQSLAAHRGREPGLELNDGAGGARRLQDWARELCDRLQPICEVLDGEDPERPYSASLERQCELVEDPDLTPSARMLAEMRANGEPFFALAKRMSHQHRDFFRARGLELERRTFFEDLAESSLRMQEEIEASDSQSFAEFLQNYFAQR